MTCQILSLLPDRLHLVAIDLNLIWHSWTQCEHQNSLLFFEAMTITYFFFFIVTSINRTTVPLYFRPKYPPFSFLSNLRWTFTGFNRITGTGCKLAWYFNSWPTRPFRVMNIRPHLKLFKKKNNYKILYISLITTLNYITSHF